MNPGRKIRYIYVSQVLPYFLCMQAFTWDVLKAGVAAEVIGVPSGSIGEKSARKNISEYS